MYIDYCETPLGTMEIMASTQGITQVIFSGSLKSKICSSQLTDYCKLQILQYFSGKLTKFKLPLDLRGTPFQKNVWANLRQISFGDVISYTELASKVKNRHAVRAVGTANGRNPISLIVPCHRVIAKNGSLAGYAGGIARKHWLLKHEGFDIDKLPLNKQLNLSKVIQTRQAKTEFLN